MSPPKRSSSSLREEAWLAPMSRVELTAGLISQVWECPSPGWVLHALAGDVPSSSGTKMVSSTTFLLCFCCTGRTPSTGSVLQALEREGPCFSRTNCKNKRNKKLHERIISQRTRCWISRTMLPCMRIFLKESPRTIEATRTRSWRPWTTTTSNTEQWPSRKNCTHNSDYLLFSHCPSYYGLVLGACFEAVLSGSATEFNSAHLCMQLDSLHSLLFIAELHKLLMLKFFFLVMPQIFLQPLIHDGEFALERFLSTVYPLMH